MADMTVKDFLINSKETLNLIEPFRSSHKNGKDINVVFSTNSYRTKEFKIVIKNNSFSGYEFEDSNIYSMYIKDCLKDSKPIAIADCIFKSAEIINGVLGELNELFIVFEIPKQK